MVRLKVLSLHRLSSIEIRCDGHTYKLFINLIQKYMYVFRRQATMQRGIATLLAIALVLWAVGANMFNVAEAGNLTYIKDTLSDSNPGSLSNHEIEFLSPTGVAAGQTITVVFPNGFNISTSSVAFGDIDLEISGVDQTLVNGLTPAATEWGVDITSQTLTLEAGASESLPALATATIKIGTNANGGVNRVTNHTATTSYEFTVTAGAADSGQFRVAIIENVLVTANVDTTFAFAVLGTTTAVTCNGASSTSAVSTNTTLPFGTVAAGPANAKTLCQDLTVATNAIHGYVVTVEQDQNLLSTTGADIDGFIDGNWTVTPAGWQSPTNNVLNENTWGHWGLTSSDNDTPRTLEFGSNQWVAASTSPAVIMGHTGPADGTTAGIGRASIGYRIEITALQEAGDDYNTTLTYIATPTF